ncbi:MAG: type I-G CRISPR-associated protein Csb2 [Acidimicrobiales bacterium]
MLAVRVRLLHGTIRVGSPDATVAAGLSPDAEWPPSPARLYSALVAGDGTGERCTGTTGAELRWLESQKPPLIYASPLDSVEKSGLVPRFVIVDKTTDSSTHSYPCRGANMTHPGSRLSPRETTVVYVWKDASPDARHLSALRYRASRVGYLGCADSPVQVSVSDALDNSLPDAWYPDITRTTGRHILPVPYQGFLDALDDAYKAWRGGSALNRAWIRSERVVYRAPDEPLETLSAGRQVIWLRFSPSISGRKLLGVTATVKEAILDQLQRLLPGVELPAMIHGHHPSDQRGSPQADFLALVRSGDTYATGRIFGAAISLPKEAAPELVEQVRSAAFELRELCSPDWFTTSVTIHGGQARPETARPERWTKPSRTWLTVTPVVYERWTKGSPGLDEVARWCSNSGLPESVRPVSVKFSKRPLLAGALDLPPSLVFRTGRERRPYSHMQIEFNTEIEGPIALGRGRQLGLGLCLPVQRGARNG